ncbi:Crp/Fnr family transcriptional regulator [Jeotgalibaca sp. A122]|uniref:Crp/Fnr family transcriptional regulator n=1 Tax=Jeotgalibaca sp. A122 TaxID=3457322 RepID=UPI003FD2F9EE
MPNNQPGYVHSCVSLVPIFNHLEVEQMDEISKTAHTRHFKKGEFIYQPQEESDSLYIVHKGWVRIYRLTENGKEQLVRFLGPGDFTGEMALFRSSVHDSFAEATRDTAVCVITKDDLQPLLANYPAISLKIMEEFSRRLEQSERQTTIVATEKVEVRLAMFLVELMEEGSSVVNLPMSKKDLASFLGTTPETISRKLGSLEDRGLIKQISNKKIEIMDADELLLG